MINIHKQVEYWVSSAIDDFESAKILIERKRFLHGLFFCHLVIEKSLKAHVVKETEQIAPRSHNLIFLLEKCNLELTEEEEIFLGILMKYQLQGRYPDYNPVIPKIETIIEYLNETERLMLWLKRKL
ncbi:MAG: HEPN domain-containing protein [Salinivirgaceae bacterium]